MTLVWAPENLFKRHLPFVLLTGFLGSGKTTLLNRILQEPRMANTAVAINEFGDIALDHNFITAPIDDVIVLANGCMCCLATDDLSASLERILRKGVADGRPEFRNLIIETSGLADPEGVIQSIVDNPIASRLLWLDRIVTTVDAIYGLEQLEQHGEARKQAMLADCIVVSKPDLVGDARLSQVVAELTLINPRAEIVIGPSTAVDTSRLLSPSFFEDNSSASFVGSWVSRQAELLKHTHDDQGSHAHHDHGHGSHADDVETISLSTDTPIDWRAFSLWLGHHQRAYGARLLRVKGILNVIGSREPVVIHAVQSTLHVPIALERWPDDDRRSRLVFILRDAAGDDLRRSWEELVTAYTRQSTIESVPSVVEQRG